MEKELELKEENRKENDNSLSFLDSHGDCLCEVRAYNTPMLERLWN